jgi:hypothetical protein
MNKLILITFSLIFLSCGQAQELVQGEQTTIYKVSPAEAENYSYELRSNSCSTGKHESESFTGICKNLLDNTLNKDCALEEREELFINSECSGNFS